MSQIKSWRKVLGKESKEALIKRKNVVLGDKTNEVSKSVTSTEVSNIPDRRPDFSVLVVNSSRAMANVITEEIKSHLPASTITYAPTVDLASFILKKDQIDLVVSSPLLPDGSISKLEALLERDEKAPEIVIMGDMDLEVGKDLFRGNLYEIAALKRISSGNVQGSRGDAASRETSMVNLGADIRNDLNNPLQEIVAMVYVAKSHGLVSEPTQQALHAIESAAKKMAGVVNELEGRIRNTV